MKKKDLQAEKISGVKAFDPNLKCRDMQYAIGETFEIEKGKKLRVCPDGEGEAGLHFCENPLDVFGYYPPSDSRFCEVESIGDAQRHDEDSKVAASKLYIKTEISLRKLVDLSVTFILNRVKWEEAKESNTGYQSAATNTGYQSAASVEGLESVAISLGVEGKAKGKKGCFLVLAEWEQRGYDWHRINVMSYLVDGELVKEDTFYTLTEGKLVESTNA